MLKVVRKKGPESYVPKSERDLPKEEQTVIIMKPLGVRKSKQIEDSAIVVDDGKVAGFMANTMQLDKVLAMMSGWHNVAIESAEGLVQVPFDPSEKEEMFEMLPEEWQKELIEEYGSDSKNSDKKVAKPELVTTGQ
ncbi:MAG: hypothetical protein CL489_10955 [Acidobacteria bacterium]|nr:hypothetical protein [Acidobacteriota bacterium]